MKFTDLQLIDPILKALEKKGYTDPTPIQQKAIPTILEGRDLLGTAQTGTGKTAAFAIPILQLLNEKPSKSGQIKALILTPTRELAIQIEENFKEYGENLRLKNLVIFGGVKQAAQQAALRKGVDILVATPGRLLDLISQGLISLKHIEIFVLDEADRMLDMGFVHDVKRLVKLLPPKRQTLFFSATFPEEIQNLAKTMLINPVRAEVQPVSSTAQTISQAVYYVGKDDKLNLLTHLLKDPKLDQVLIFSRTKHGADKIAKKLHQTGITAQAIHGNKSQNARQNALSNFKNKTTRVLVATDIAARGIDIDDLKYVINFELSDVSETYVHRIGRTGRAGASGSSISFVDGLDLVNLKNTEKLIGMKIPVERDHPYHVDNLVAEKRDSNNKPFTPRARPQAKKDTGYNKPKNKGFSRNR